MKVHFLWPLAEEICLTFIKEETFALSKTAGLLPSPDETVSPGSFSAKKMQREN